MAFLQVRDIDDRLYSSLKELARLENRSLSQEVITIFQEYLNNPNKTKFSSTREFLNLTGSWSDSKSAAEIIKDIKVNRNSKHRFRIKNGLFD